MNSVNFSVGFVVWISCDFSDVVTEWVKIKMPRNTNKGIRK